MFSYFRDRLGLFNYCYCIFVMQMISGVTIDDRVVSCKLLHLLYTFILSHKSGYWYFDCQFWFS